MQHELITSRFQRGRGAIAGSGMNYGTSAHCSCGDWTDKVNQAPSQGGRQAMKNAFEANHLPNVTAERDVEILREKLAAASEHVAHVIREGYSDNAIDRTIAGVQYAHEALLADLAALAAR